MRLEAKREHELKKRRGLALRTIGAVIWLGICFAGAFFLMRWIFESELLNINFFYNQLRIPRSVSQEWIIIGFTILIVIGINFFVLVGYSLFSPTGRRRPGTPSLYSSDPDPDDHKYDYRR